MSATPERWRSLQELYQAALDRPPEQRSAFLKAACPDERLRREAESLLGGATEAYSPRTRPTGTPQDSVAPGSNLGPYRIGGLIGAGGMGEVYRARDIRLGRDVALKILRASMMDDRDWRARFMREAQTASRLNHPNIVTIYDIGECDGRVYIAMEYVAGTTLAAVIPESGLPVGEALKHAIPIAAALAKAHAEGVIHRDLKPGNIMVAPDGAIKVLDFGMAKLVDEPVTAEDETRTATPETLLGMVMGTPAYMSPDQAEGKAVDARSDIFSFGTVLYEMVTGKRAFRGTSVVATMAAVMYQEPEPLPLGVPRELDRIVTRCMRKDPARRYQDAGDLRIALEDLRDDITANGSTSVVAPAQSRARRWVEWTVLAALAATATAAALLWYLNRPQPIVRFPALTQVTFDAGLATTPAISPDGKLVAYASDRAGPQLDIWVQQLGSGEPVRLTRESADSYDPAFSPDGTTIVFRSEVEGGGLYSVPSLGGQVRRIAKDGRNPRFSPDGKWIAYRIGHPLWSGGGGGVYVMPATGGSSRQLSAGFAAAGDLIWAPDSRHYLFAGFFPGKNGRSDTADWWLSTLEDNSPVQTGGVAATTLQGLRRTQLQAWDPLGKFIVFSARAGDSVNLWKIPISIRTGKVAGAVQPLTFGTTHQTTASLSAAGALAFASVSRTVDAWSLPMDSIEGRVSGKPERLTTDGTVGAPSVSRAGDRMVYESKHSGNPDVWFLNLKTGMQTQMTVTPFAEIIPVIRADGLQVAYCAEEAGKENIYYLGLPASGRPAALQKLCDDCGAPLSLSPDGANLLVVEGMPLRVLSYQVPLGKRTELVKHATNNIFEPQFSSDGKWFLFLLHGPGWSRVYAAAYRGTFVPQAEWIPLTDGQSWEDKPRWSPDDSAIYFTSDRDGFHCIWAQRLDAAKRPTGPAVAVYHFHNARLSLMNVEPGELDISVARDRLIFNQGEETGNVWLTKLPPR